MKNVGINQGNLLVWGLISGLFVASASQCSPKKRAGYRSQSSASVSGRPEKVDTVSKKVASAAGKMGSDVLVKDNESESGYDERICKLLEEVGNLGHDVVNLSDSADYRNFLESIKSDARDKIRSMDWDVLRYYEACSIVWMFLEQSDLVNRSSDQGSSRGVLDAFVRLLSPSRQQVTPQTEDIGDVFKNFSDAEIAEFKNLVKNKYNSDVANKLASVLGMPLSLVVLNSKIDTIYYQVRGGVCSHDSDVGWLWDIDGCVGKLAMILTKIRWHLLAIFGSDNGYLDGKLGCSLYPGHDGDFLKLVEFYRGVHPLDYKSLNGIDFGNLGVLVQNALNGWPQRSK